MSWWVCLQDQSAKPWCSYGSGAPDACSEPCYPAVTIRNHTHGGTYAVGGVDSAELNITYNYSRHFHSALGGSFTETIHGKPADEVISVLEKAVEILGTKRDRDYWKPTPGNAGFALSILLAWAREYPSAIFHVS
jgi:hypothetical protein